MKIRHLLLVLALLLGLSLLATVAALIRVQSDRYFEARQIVLSNSIREDLLLLEQQLMRERTQTYILLALGGGESQIALAREATDQPLERTASALSGSNVAQGEVAIEALFANSRRQFENARRAADDAIGLASDSAERRVEAGRWFEAVSFLLARFQSYRLLLLGSDPAPTTWANGNLLRYYSSLFADALSRNEALLFAKASLQRSGESLPGAERDAVRAELALELLQARAISASPEASQRIDALTLQYRTTVQPLQARLLQPSGVHEVSADAWSSAAGAMLDATHEFQEQILRGSRARVEAELELARNGILLWSLLGLGGALCVIGVITVVQSRIVGPIERLVTAMLRLANDDVDTPIPRLRRDDEIGAMNNALRVFKANAIRRARLERNRKALHDRLKDTYRVLRRDLEAAASIQIAMLPPSAEYGQVRFHSLFRPSTLVAGDTYNLMDLGDGRIAFFLVDVAGHGAPAALVSAALQGILSQELAGRGYDDPLSQICTRINSNWPENLPYFTMILGRVDPAEDRISLVQAGHPTPITISSGGAIQTLGNGGFPIGLFEEVEHEQIDESFRSGDRLILYSDGLIEAEDVEHRQYSAERLLDLARECRFREGAFLISQIDADVRSWCGSKPLQDDLSLIILERN